MERNWAEEFLSPRFIISILGSLEDVEAPASPGALHGVGRVGDELKLVDDELGNGEDAFGKAGHGDIRDAAVDDDAGVQKLWWNRPIPFEPEGEKGAGILELPSGPDAHDHPEISHDEADEDVEGGGLLQGHVEEGACGVGQNAGGDQPSVEADDPAQHDPQGNLPEEVLEKEGGSPHGHADPQPHGPRVIPDPGKDIDAGGGGDDQKKHLGHCGSVHLQGELQGKASDGVRKRERNGERTFSVVPDRFDLP